jgi:hypothetical protein
MPLLFWLWMPLLVMLWSPVVWGILWLGTGRVPPRWLRRNVADQSRVLTSAGLAGWLSLAFATTPSMPWHSSVGTALAQATWTWWGAMVLATAVPAGLVWLVIRSRGRAG